MKLLKIILDAAHRSPESAMDRRRRLLREVFAPNAASTNQQPAVNKRLQLRKP